MRHTVGNQKQLQPKYFVPENGDSVVVACGEDEAAPGGDAGDPIVMVDFGLELGRRVAVRGEGNSIDI